MILESIMNFKKNHRVKFGHLIGVVISVRLRFRMVTILTVQGVRVCKSGELIILDDEVYKGDWRQSDKDLVYDNPLISTKHMAIILNRTPGAVRSIKYLKKQVA